jgi:CheY-like chemotaxis protein
MTTPADDSAAKPLAGVRVFLAEDEYHVMELIEEILGELGCTIADVASNVDDALAIAGKTQAQIALLDVNLHGTMIYPAAEVLARRGIPIVFSTGYGLAGIESKWKAFPVLQKPFAMGQLAAALTQAFAASR